MTPYGPHNPDAVPQMVTVRGRSGEHQVPVDPAITRQRAAINNLAAGLTATPTQPQTVGTSDEWALFVAAVREAARPGGAVHQCDVRPLIRGRVQPKHIGLLYRRAVTEGLLVRLGYEESDDLQGKNAGRMEPVYELLRGAA